MTSLHEGHKTGERLQCIDDMLFNECKDTKDTILRAFWWYRKNSVPLDKLKQARGEIQAESYAEHCDDILTVELRDVLEILDKLIESEEK